MASQSEAREAIYDAVATMTKKAVEHGGPSGAAMLRDAAIAWRAAAGGQQPGSSVVQK
ncbi:MAG TPA: hypothetical protein VGE38_07095 [Nocardioides sp.]|uniref:hypothetical protein n=1 Tax=Nocardioides sp. TaxID=35761 RepID=UPI002EDAED67